MDMIITCIILLLMMAALISMVVHFIRHGTMRGTGMSSTAYMGASYEMLSQDQRKAAEVIVEDQAGTKREDDDTGEPDQHSPDDSPVR